MFVGGSTFYATFRMFHVVWLKGRVGGGKTSIAFALALMLLRDGLVNEIYSNIPSIALQPEAGDIPRDCAVIIDEGGLFMKFTSDFERVAAFMRKQNLYVILPSFIPPNRSFAMLTLQRTVNYRRIIPILPLELWAYKHELTYGSQKDSSTFLWSNPKSVWGLYDTTATPADDAGISSWIEEYSKAAQVSYGNWKKKDEAIEKLADSGKPAGEALAATGLGRDIREAGGEIGAAGDTISRAAESIRASTKRIRRH